jgi:AraC-like DNA-binding protein
MMPGKIDGIELSRLLKEDPCTSHIPLILLTARADAKSKLEGLNTGADDYLIKPFDPDELQVRVRNQLNRMEALRKRFSESSVLFPGGIQVESHEIQFIKKIVRYTEEHIADPEFDVRDLKDVVGMSYTQVYRKTLALTGKTPGKLIREIRLENAARLLRNNHDSITSIALECGFQNPSYFASCFRKKYGQTPRRFMAEQARTEITD